MNQQEMLTLINQVGKDNPKLQMLAQLMAQQQTEQPAEKPEVTGPLLAQIKQQEALIKRLSTSNKKLKDKIRLLVENLTYRIEVNDTLAAATGSCAHCWGEDPNCPECNGKGVPGSLPIDEEAFMNFVQPIIKQYTQSRNRQNQAGHQARNNLNNSLN
ncbi:MAG: hypothetical protein AAF206_06710 [Bacteroidota bacterium]